MLGQREYSIVANIIHMMIWMHIYQAVHRTNRSEIGKQKCSAFVAVSIKKLKMRKSGMWKRSRKMRRRCCCYFFLFIDIFYLICCWWLAASLTIFTSIDACVSITHSFFFAHSISLSPSLHRAHSGIGTRFTHAQFDCFRLNGTKVLMLCVCTSLYLL